MTRTGVYETQLSLDAALDRAGENWQREARRIIGLFCDTGLPFSSDDVREVLADPPNLNALGALFRACANEGLIVEVGSTRSRRPDAHGRRVVRWRNAV